MAQSTKFNGEKTLERFRTTIETLTDLSKTVTTTLQSLKKVDDVLVCHLVFQVFYSIGKIFLKEDQMFTDIATANNFLDNITNTTKIPYEGFKINQAKLRVLTENDRTFIEAVKTFLGQLSAKRSAPGKRESLLYTALQTELGNLKDKPYLQLILASAIVQYMVTFPTPDVVSSDLKDLYQTIWDYKLAQNYTCSSTSRQNCMSIIETKFPPYEYLLYYFAESAARPSTVTPRTPPPSSTSTIQTPQPHMNIIPALLGGASVLLAVVSTVFAN